MRPVSKSLSSCAMRFSMRRRRATRVPQCAGGSDAPSFTRSAEGAYALATILRGRRETAPKAWELPERLGCLHVETAEIRVRRHAGDGGLPDPCDVAHLRGYVELQPLVVPERRHHAIAGAELELRLSDAASRRGIAVVAVADDRRPGALLEANDPHVGASDDIDRAKREREARPEPGLEKRQREQRIGDRPLTGPKRVAKALLGDACGLLDGVGRTLLE